MFENLRAQSVQMAAAIRISKAHSASITSSLNYREKKILIGKSAIEKLLKKYVKKELTI
jgi:hypothetical protein